MSMNFFPDPETVAEIVRRFEAHKPVSAVFWAKETERHHWRLYIASDELSRDGYLTATPRLLDLTRDDPSLFELTHEVMLISGDDPLALAVKELASHARPRRNQPFPVEAGMLGEVRVDSAWIYPVRQPVSA